jgi:hypothetical protein
MIELATRLHREALASFGDVDASSSLLHRLRRADRPFLADVPGPSGHAHGTI